jgi:hypothetical protein
MANFVYNIALGRIAEKVADGATIKLLVLKAAAADSVLKDLDTVAAILANGSTDEADFTNYARATLGSLTVTVDDSTDSVSVDCADVVFTSAGGASNNTTTDVIIYEEVAGGDANCIPLVQLDAVFTTDGNNVTLQMNAAGFFGAS